MKFNVLKIRYLILAISFIIFSNIHSQCLIGNKFLNSNANNNQNFLFFEKVEVTELVTVQSLGLTVENNGVNVIMGLYSDSQGEPKNLLVFSQAHTLDKGENTIDIPNTQLTPGNYWIMRIFNGTAIANINTDNQITSKTLFWTFGSPLPNPVSQTSSITIGSTSLWLNYLCTPVKPDIHNTDGDIYLDNIQRGIIMKSPIGECWRTTINDDGILKSIKIECPD